PSRNSSCRTDLPTRDATRRRIHLQARAGAGCRVQHAASRATPTAPRARRRDARKAVPDIVATEPALIAQHCADAGLNEQAVRYRLTAGQQALGRSAMTEAVAQLTKGLEALAKLPEGIARQQHELDLRRGPILRSVSRSDEIVGHKPREIPDHLGLRT